MVGISETEIAEFQLVELDPRLGASRLLLAHLRIGGRDPKFNVVTNLFGIAKAKEPQNKGHAAN